MSKVSEMQLAAGIILAVASFVVVCSAHGHRYHVLDNCVKVALPELMSVPVSQLMKETADRMHQLAQDEIISRFEETVLSQTKPDDLIQLRADCADYINKVSPIVDKHTCLDDALDHHLYVKKHYPELHDIINYTLMSSYLTW